MVGELRLLGRVRQSTSPARAHTIYVREREHWIFDHFVAIHSEACTSRMISSGFPSLHQHGFHGLVSLDMVKVNALVPQRSEYTSSLEIVSSSP